jgi:hypothetical protein
MEKRSLLVVCRTLRAALWTSVPVPETITNVSPFGTISGQPVLSFPLAFPCEVAMPVAQSQTS